MFFDSLAMEDVGDSFSVFICHLIVVYNCGGISVSSHGHNLLYRNIILEERRNKELSDTCVGNFSALAIDSPLFCHGTH